jgi:hypothetical protein
LELAPNHRRLKVGRLHKSPLMSERINLKCNCRLTAQPLPPHICRLSVWRPYKGRKQKGYAMSSKMKYAAAFAACALGVAGAVAIATPSPSWAAPVASNTAAVRTAASNQVTDVQYHRRGYYGRGYYGGRYFRRGYAYPYRGYAYPYRGYAYPYYPYAYPYPYLGFGFGWGGW